MKRRIFAVLTSALGVICLSLIGFMILNLFSKQFSGEIIEIENPLRIYQNSLEPINHAQNLVLTTSIERETTLANTSFLEILQQTTTYNGLNTGNPCVVLEETATIGPHTVFSSETYLDSTVYLTVNECHFSCILDKESYMSRLSPAILIEPTLYDSITGVDTGKHYIITFKNATAPEQWLNISAQIWNESIGTATISYDGAFLDSTYTFSYTIENVTIKETITNKIEFVTKEITPPSDTSLYTPITYLDGPKMLERASGYLIQANNVSANYSDRIYFEAFGDTRTQQISMHSNEDAQWSAYVDTKIHLANDSRGEHLTEYSKQELFTDGHYTLATDGSKALENTDITVDVMQNYLQDLLVSTVMLPKYITTSDMETTGNTIRITYSGNPEFANFLCVNACNILYQNPDLLKEDDTIVSTKKLTCYLETDAISGLPIASGIDYVGSYTSEELPYQIHYQAEQSYILPSSIAADEIKKAAGV